MEKLKISKKISWKNHKAIHPQGVNDIIIKNWGCL